MATRTKLIATVGLDCSVEIDYNDVTFYLTALRVINNSNAVLHGRATVTANNRTFTKDFPANSTTVQNIPTGAATRFELHLDALGRLDGVDYEFWQ